MAIKNFVVDTNILVSAFVFKSKNPTEALKRCLTNGKVVYSAKILEEFKTTLLAAKFDPFVSRELREFSLSLFIDSCDLLTPTKKITICRDKNDNKFLELAFVAHAACIVTGDPDLLVLHPFENIPIITPKEFLEKF